MSSALIFCCLSLWKSGIRNIFVEVFWGTQATFSQLKLLLIFMGLFFDDHQFTAPLWGPPIGSELSTASGTRCLPCGCSAAIFAVVFGRRRWCRLFHHNSFGMFLRSWNRHCFLMFCHSVSWWRFEWYWIYHAAQQLWHWGKGNKESTRTLQVWGLRALPSVCIFLPSIGSSDLIAKEG